MYHHISNLKNRLVNLFVFGSEKSGKKTFIYNLVKYSGISIAILDDYSNNNLIRLCYSSNQTKVILNFHICDTTNLFLQICKSLQPDMIIIIAKTLENNLFDFLIEIRNIFSNKFFKFLINNLKEQTQVASKISKNDSIQKILDSDQLNIHNDNDPKIISSKKKFKLCKKKNNRIHKKNLNNLLVNMTSKKLGNESFQYSKKFQKFSKIWKTLENLKIPQVSVINQYNELKERIYQKRNLLTSLASKIQMLEMTIKKNSKNYQNKLNNLSENNIKLPFFLLTLEKNANYVIKANNNKTNLFLMSDTKFDMLSESEIIKKYHKKEGDFKTKFSLDGKDNEMKGYFERNNLIEKFFSSTYDNRKESSFLNFDNTDDSENWDEARQMKLLNFKKCSNNDDNKINNSDSTKI